MNARYFTGHTPIITLGLKHRSEFLRDLSGAIVEDLLGQATIRSERGAREVGWLAGDGVGGLRHLAVPYGEGLPSDRYCLEIGSQC
jgi:hypothetical protein